MAYTTVKYETLNPREEVLPYALLYEQAYEKEQKRQQEYFDWINSSSEILKNDLDYKDARAKYDQDLATAAEALSRGDLRTARSLDLRGVSSYLKQGEKKAKILSELIKKQEEEADKYAFGKVYSRKTRLKDIGDDSSYTKESLDRYRALGLSLGKSINAQASPQEKGTILRNSKILLEQGYSHSQILDMLADSNSNLRQQVDKIRGNSSITDESQLEKIDKAIIEGVLSGVGVTTTAERNPQGFTSPGEALSYKISYNQYEKQKAMDRYNETGDIRELRKTGTRVTEYGKDEKTGKPTGVVIGNYDYPIIGWKDNGAPILGKPKTVESSNKSGNDKNTDKETLKTLTGNNSTPVVQEPLYDLSFTANIKVESNGKVSAFQVGYVEPGTGRGRLLNISTDETELGAILYLLSNSGKLNNKTKDYIKRQLRALTEQSGASVEEIYGKADIKKEELFKDWYKNNFGVTAPNNGGQGSQSAGTGGSDSASEITDLIESVAAVDSTASSSTPQAPKTPD